MAKQRVAWDSFGGRVKFARDALGMTQDDMIEALKKHGVTVSGAAYSKLETGETQRIHIKYLLAISQILNVSANELLTGIVATPAQFETDEANAAGAMLDAMLPRQRTLAMQLLRAISELDQDIHAEVDELRGLLEATTDLIANGARSRIVQHIHRTISGSTPPVSAVP